MARELSNEIRYAALQLALSIPLPPGAVWGSDQLIDTAKKIEAYLNNEDKSGAS